jgi:uncharacterized protein DUF4331
MKLWTPLVGGALVLAAVATPETIEASSHREAPFVAKNPKVDGTDFYMFNSYETGRGGFVTLIANYIPLEDAYGGPNYFSFDPEAIYEIHIDNNADAIEDITFQFKFSNALANNGNGLKLKIGPAGQEKDIAVPYNTIGTITDPTTTPASQNLLETYKINVIRGPRRSGTVMPVKETGSGSETFRKPFDNVGTKTIANYAAYSAGFIKSIDIPGCGVPGKVFVGQRAEGFAVNLGQVFDLVNFSAGASASGQANVVGAADQGKNIIKDKNISTIALEVSASCLTAGSQKILGGWTTASVRQARVINPTPTFAQPAREGGPFVQVSRVGAPLANEVVIGLPDKDRFNSSEPKDDTQWADYITNPTLPFVLEILFGGAGVKAPTNFPRADLFKAFATGIAPVTANGSVCEYLRLNTDPAIVGPPRSAATQSDMGALGCFANPTADTDATLDTNAPNCDPQGFPNGRRPGDDVVDIEVRAAMGALVKKSQAQAGGCLHNRDSINVAVPPDAGCFPYVDGAQNPATKFKSVFPYLNDPVPGSP